MKSKRARETDGGIEDPAPPSSAPAEKKRKRERSDNELVREPEVKQKKQKKDKDKKASRKERKEQRKNLQDLPAEEQEDADADPSTAKAETKKNKESRRGRKEDQIARSDSLAPEVEGKKQKNKESRRGRKEDQIARSDSPAPEVKRKKQKDKDGQDAPSTDTKSSRHIVFVGNLPFSATSASITKYFRALNPLAVRCLTTRDGSESFKGVAFVEFRDARAMRTCLDRFHHSMFDDGVSAPRRINVELTAGGGGKTQFRKDKIRDKNKKLDENRSKRIEKEMNEKHVKGGAKDENAHKGIHPSRLARVAY